MSTNAKLDKAFEALRSRGHVIGTTFASPTGVLLTTVDNNLYTQDQICQMAVELGADLEIY